MTQPANASQDPVARPSPFSPTPVEIDLVGIFGPYDPSHDGGALGPITYLVHSVESDRSIVLGDAWRWGLRTTISNWYWPERMAPFKKAGATSVRDAVRTIVADASEPTILPVAVDDVYAFGRLGLLTGLAKGSRVVFLMRRPAEEAAAAWMSAHPDEPVRVGSFDGETVEWLIHQAFLGAQKWGLAAAFLSLLGVDRVDLNVKLFRRDRAEFYRRLTPQSSLSKPDADSLEEIESDEDRADGERRIEKWLREKVRRRGDHPTDLAWFI